MMLKKGSLFQKICIHIAVILGVLFFVECFICNYKHFLFMPKEKLNYQVDELIINGLRYDENEDCYVATHNKPTVEILDIDCEVKTILFDANPVDEKKYQLDVSILYTDETRLNYVNFGKNIQIVKDYLRSRYIQEDFNGKTNKLKFEININAGEKIYFNGVSLNKRIPFVFSFARVAYMLTFSFGFYIFIMLFYYRKRLANIENKEKIYLASKIGISALSFVLVLIVFGAMFNGFANYVGQTSGTQISQELVDSFLHGKFSILTKPTDEFLSIADPYVPDNRFGYYLWDHVFYKGTYYSYYGVTPVFLLFIPFKLLTGLYLYDGYAVLLFSSISIIFMSLAYYKLIKKYCSNLPLVFQLSGYIILFMSCGILTNIVRPAFYEVATSCAFMCLTIALYFLAKSNLLFKDEKIQTRHVAWFTVWMSLAVLARATYALYALCAVVIMAIAFIYRRKLMSKKENIYFLLAAFLPFIVFGGFQCIYNYARFGSFFEFGIQYSLTINDFTKTQFHFSFAFTSLWNFLFAMPSFTDGAYFIKPVALTFGHSGYYFFETYSAIGLFNRVPILYMIFALPFMGKNMKIKDKLVFALKYVLPCIIIPIIVVMVTWESGFAVRYYSDFAWAMVLFALFMFFYYFNQKQEADDHVSMKYYAIIFGVTLLFSFVGQMAIVYDFVPNLGRHIGSEDFRFTYKYYRIAKELAFWK